MCHPGSSSITIAARTAPSAVRVKSLPLAGAWAAAVAPARGAASVATSASRKLRRVIACFRGVPSLPGGPGPRGRSLVTGQEDRCEQLRFPPGPAESHPVPVPHRPTPVNTMKTASLLLLASLLPALPSAPRPQVREGQEGQEKGQEKGKTPSSAVTGFVKGERERLTQGGEGSWMLIGYTDPEEPPMDDQVNGFATFDQGFLTMIVAVDSVEHFLFRLREHVFFHSGAYRYRF